MKLKDNYITHKTFDETILLATGKEAENFHGIVKLNDTAALIVEALKKDTSIEEILNKLVNEFPNIYKETLKTDLEEILSQLESINAIEK